MGNGYDGVRRGRLAAGVGGTLPRMVLPDSVDSVDSVEVVCPVGSGLAKASSSVGDRADTGSSLMGEMRRASELETGAPTDAFAPFRRARCCLCRALDCNARRRSSSFSSGEALATGVTSWSSS